MSDRIDQILAVLGNARSQRSSFVSDVRYVRREAAKAVARQLKIDVNTVSDKFMRGLRPDVRDTAQFDRLIEGWLIKGSDELKQVLLKHSVDSAEKGRIEGFFERTI